MTELSVVAAACRNHFLAFDRKRFGQEMVDSEVLGEKP